MKVNKIEKEALISRRLAILLDELNQELHNTTQLLAQLRIRDLTPEQAEVILGELSAAILHLHEHTEGLDEFIMDEIDGSRKIVKLVRKGENPPG